MASLPPASPAAAHAPSVTKRDGSTVPFDSERIRAAIERAFEAAYGLPLSPDHAGRVQSLTDEVVGQVVRGPGSNGDASPDTVHVERVQNEVEAALGRAGEEAVARRFGQYRQERAQERRGRQALSLERADGTTTEIDFERLRRRVDTACDGLPGEALFERATAGFYDGMARAEIDKALVMAAKSLIEEDPGYSYVAARLLLGTVYREVTGGGRVAPGDRAEVCRAHLADYLAEGVRRELLDPALTERFDLERLSGALRPARSEELT